MRTAAVSHRTPRSINQPSKVETRAVAPSTAEIAEALAFSELLAFSEVLAFLEVLVSSGMLASPRPRLLPRHTGVVSVDGASGAT